MGGPSPGACSTACASAAEADARSGAMRRLAMLAMMTFAINAEAPQAVVEGLASSPVRVIAYEDLQCPDCATYRKMLDEKLLAAYRAKAAFEHRDFPLPKHSWARPAAVAARFFHEVN